MAVAFVRILCLQLVRVVTHIYYRRLQNEYEEQALRLYTDRDSGGIRMEASVLRGQFKRYQLSPLTATTKSERTNLSCLSSTQETYLDSFHNASCVLESVDAKNRPQNNPTSRTPALYFQVRLRCANRSRRSK